MKHSVFANAGQQFEAATFSAGHVLPVIAAEESIQGFLKALGGLRDRMSEDDFRALNPDYLDNETLFYALEDHLKEHGVDPSILQDDDLNKLFEELDLLLAQDGPELPATSLWRKIPGITDLLGNVREARNTLSPWIKTMAEHGIEAYGYGYVREYGEEEHRPPLCVTDVGLFNRYLIRAPFKVESSKRVPIKDSEAEIIVRLVSTMSELEVLELYEVEAYLHDPHSQEVLAYATGYLSTVQDWVNSLDQGDFYYNMDAHSALLAETADHMINRCAEFEVNEISDLYIGVNFERCAVLHVRCWELTRPLRGNEIGASFLQQVVTALSSSHDISDDEFAVPHDCYDNELPFFRVNLVTMAAFPFPHPDTIVDERADVAKHQKLRAQWKRDVVRLDTYLQHMDLGAPIMTYREKKTSQLDEMSLLAKHLGHQEAADFWSGLAKKGPEEQNTVFREFAAIIDGVAEQSGRPKLH